MKVILVLALVVGTVLAKPHSTSSKDVLRELIDLLEVKTHDRRLITNGFSASEQQAIVDAHNTYRSQVTPRAGNMKTMTWDATVAHLAQEWANECKSPSGNPHGQPDDKKQLLGDAWVGQNMYWGTTGGKNAVDAWWEEIYFYDFCSKSQAKCMSGKVCGHYTQLIWADSTKVGCGVASCSGKPQVVCNYLPGGNFNGAQPYLLASGDSCGNCGDHFCGEHGYATAYGTACTCTCAPGYKGSRCDQIDCGITDDSSCRFYGLSASSDYCNPSRGFTMGNGKKITVACPWACGICPASAADITTTAAPTSGSGSSCTDQSVCKYYATKYCSYYTDNTWTTKISQLCPKKCGTCTKKRNLAKKAGEVGKRVAVRTPQQQVIA